MCQCRLSAPRDVCFLPSLFSSSLSCCTISWLLYDCRFQGGGSLCPAPTPPTLPLEGPAQPGLRCPTSPGKAPQGAEQPLCVHSWAFPSVPPRVPRALLLFLTALCPLLGFRPHGSRAVTPPSQDSLRPAPFRVLCTFRDWRLRQVNRMPLGWHLCMCMSALRSRLMASRLWGTLESWLLTSPQGPTAAAGQRYNASWCEVGAPRYQGPEGTLAGTSTGA